MPHRLLSDGRARAVSATLSPARDRAATVGPRSRCAPVPPAGLCDLESAREQARMVRSTGSVLLGFTLLLTPSALAAQEAPYAAVAADGGFRAANPAQRWSSRFDERGFTTTPDDGGWSWGLELVGYGREGEEPATVGPAPVRADGARLVSARDEVLTEWYVNDGRGLEHGYTLHRRPGAGDAPIALHLSVRGGLAPHVAANGRDVRFRDARGISRVDYLGLTAFDAEGRSLAARLETAGGALHLVVDDRGARYPVTIDPVAQLAYVKASNAGAADEFGYSIAASGNTVVIGARGESSNAMGVNGDGSNNSASSAGAAYVFVRSGTTWSHQAYLKASNTDTNDNFGFSVAISGDTIVVGAQGEDGASTGVNGDETSNGATNSGAAYVFVRNGTTWSQQAYLKASNTDSIDGFGFAVAISGDTIVVGAPSEASISTGVNGNATNNNLFGSGAAYVFVRSGTIWSQQAYLKASNTGPSDFFGTSVGVSGDTVVVGAPDEDSAATGVNGDQSSNAALESGAAYVFVRSGTTWSQQAYLKASNTEAFDRFGNTRALAISGDTIVAGSSAENGNATGVNGVETGTLFNAGAAYVFVRSGGSWSQQAYAKASNTGSSDSFGQSVSVSGDVVAVGAGGEASNASGIGGNQSNNSLSASGAVYVFSRSGSTWSQLAYVKASNPGPFDIFGFSVALSGDLLAVGSYHEDSGATGVGGNQADESQADSGAAYLFDLDRNPGTAVYGTGSPGCSGTHTLTTSQAPMLGAPGFAILSDNAPPSSLGLLIVTDVQDLAGSDPFGIGVLLHASFVGITELTSLDLYSDALGNGGTVDFAIPGNPALLGKVFYACGLWAWTTCSLPPYGLSTTRGLAITVLVP